MSVELLEDATDDVDATSRAQTVAAYRRSYESGRMPKARRLGYALLGGLLGAGLGWLVGLILAGPTTLFAIIGFAGCALLGWSSGDMSLARNGASDVIDGMKDALFLRKELAS